MTVPLGKHPLESRLKWTGLTARPRPEGRYGGILPVMNDILQKKRTPGVVKFARTRTCSACGGARLRPEALAVRVGGRDIAALSALPVEEALVFLGGLDGDPVTRAALAPVLERLGLLRDLGLGALPLDRPSNDLGSGEWQRIRLAGQVASRLNGVLVVLDEPSAGLHPRDVRRLLSVLRRLRDAGNTVVVVEHDEAVLRAMDWLVELGPGPGAEGGRVLFNGPLSEYLAVAVGGSSPTARLLSGRLEPPTSRGRTGGERLVIETAEGEPLELRAGALNVVRTRPGERLAVVQLTGHRCINVDHSPVGKTSRSNPATYTGLFDRVRALYAKQPEARALGWGAGRFSFNTAGGRCEGCQGAGVQSLGMQFLGEVEVPCPDCGGQRFDRETRSILVRGRSISDVLDLSVAEAREHFDGLHDIIGILDVLMEVGLGYLHLGQTSATLSGGEAQRVRLAAELARTADSSTLFVLREPTVGLHGVDVLSLVGLLDRLVEEGHTVVVQEHHPFLAAAADLLVYPGTEGVTPGTEAPATADKPRVGTPPQAGEWIRLRGLRTHNLKNIDVDLPLGRTTVVTGVSGSGKSSLAFDTLFAEGRRRFVEGLSAHARSLAGSLPRPALAEAVGLPPAVAIRSRLARSPRSTVGTVSGVLDLLRLLFARAGRRECPACGVSVPARADRCEACGSELPGPLLASHFAFNRKEGACVSCGGLGFRLVPDPDRLVTDPDRSLLDGALDGHPVGRYYGDPRNKFVHLLRAAGEARGVDLGQPWSALDETARSLVLDGSGGQEFEAVWTFTRGGRTKEHRWTAPWPGLLALVIEEFERKEKEGRGAPMLPVMRRSTCEDCDGERLGPLPRGVRVGGRRLPELLSLPLADLDEQLSAALADLDSLERSAAALLQDRIRERLETLAALGLGYLSLEREAGSLSGGEARRLRIAGQAGAGLSGVVYVLDEPTLGLHPRDTHRLLDVLDGLRSRGNTLVLVEHDLEVIRRADHLLDLGPGAGEEGGRLVAAGAPAEVARTADSPTGRWLRGEARLETSRGRISKAPPVVLHRPRLHNLRMDRVEIPGTGLTGVAGLSGAGKSSLVFGVLEASLRAGGPTHCEDIEGVGDLQVVSLDDRPLGRTPASTPATILGLMEPMRKRFAGTVRARALGLKARSFSLAGKGGRCETCKGLGSIKVSMDFLADVWSPCPDCGGQRYQGPVLECRLDGMNIAELLALSLDEARRSFSEDPIFDGLELAGELGLGHLRLGQPATTFSGGEAQRLRLVRELAMQTSSAGGGMTCVAGGRRLYLFDEPTRGLHPEDVERLLRVFHRLADQGHGLVIIEHHQGLLQAMDHVVVLGPGPGTEGGDLVVAGPPDEVLR